MYDYYLLEGEEKYGLLVRQNARTLEEMYYDVSTSKWSYCDLVMAYLDAESPLFGQYKLLSEKEAVTYISRLMFMKYYDDGFCYPTVEEK